MKPALWPIGAFYFFYFAFNGVFSPYWGLYLHSLHFSAWDISILMSLPQVMRMVAPALWGWLADRRGSSVGIVRLAAVTSTLSFLIVFVATDFQWLFVGLALMSFFWSASLPLVEASAMSLLKADTGRYSRLRVWGSIGFVVTTLVAGWVIEHFGLNQLPLIVLLIMAGIAAYSFLLPSGNARPHLAESDSLWALIRQPKVIALFTVTFLMAFAHGPYYTFLSLHLQNHGFGKVAIGWLWTLGVLAEIGLFFFMPRILKSIDLGRLLLLGLGVAVLRFLTIAWLVDSLLLILLAQMCHAFTFGSHHAVSMAYFHRFFQGRHQAKGQALYIALSFGLGGTLGGLFAGAIWDSLGAAMTFSFSAISALVGLCTAMFLLRCEKVAVTG